jgi:hypothetical protein
MRFSDYYAPRSYWYAAAAKIGVGKTMQFNYPPLVAVVMKSFARLPFRPAWRLWLLLIWISLALAIPIMLRLVAQPISVAALLTAWLAALPLGALHSNILLGQVGTFLLLLWTAGIYLAWRRSDGGSALIFAAATLLKLTPVLVVPVFIIYRRWKWLAAYIGFTAALSLLGIWGSSWSVNRYYVTSVLPTMSCGTPGVSNSSLFAAVYHWFLGTVPLEEHLVPFLPKYSCAIAKLLSVSVYGFVLFCIWRRRSEQKLVGSCLAILLVSLAISPVTWFHHYMIALLPLVWLWSAQLSDPSRRHLPLLTAASVIFGSSLAAYALVLIRVPAVDLLMALIQPALTICLAILCIDSQPQSLPISEGREKALQAV